MRLKGFAAPALGVALQWLCIGTAGAQPEAPVSAQLRDCLDHVIDNEHGSRWPAEIVCYENEFSAQDRRLGEAYQALDAAAARLGPRAKDEAASGRRQWEGYRDSWCAFEQERFVEPNADIARLSCRIELTRSQLARVAQQVAVLR